MRSSTGGSVEKLVERASEIARDLRLETVRAWKARNGGLAIGYMPVYAPREILHAQGVLPVGIFGGGEDLEIIRGDAYYQSYICHIPRSTIELGLNGGLDPLDGMIFPATCDVIRNLSGMWKMQFPGKVSRYLDVPQDFHPEMGGEFFRREIEELSHDLQSRGARPLETNALRRSIAAFNENRGLVRSLYHLRSEEPWKVPTHELFLILRAGLTLPVEEASDLFRAYLDAARSDASRKPMDQARIVLAGPFCELPPLGLIKTLERSGCYIVDDDLFLIHRWIRNDIPVGDDPLRDFVLSFLRDSIPSPIRYAEVEEKGADLVRRAREAQAEGVIFCAPSFCDPALLDQPMVTKTLDAAGVPWTAFKFAENTGQFQVIREQAGTFADSIKLWSGAVS